MRLRTSSRARIFRIIAVVGVTASLTWANHRLSNGEPPLIAIDEISPLLNFSIVRVEGHLESNAIRLRRGSVMYVINDGTGILPVFASLPIDRRLPKAGSFVSAAGNLSVGSGNNIRMRVRIGEEVAVIRERGSNAFRSDFDLGAISPGHAGKWMTVSGRVSKVWKPRAGSRAPWKIVLQDHSGSLDVVHWLKSIPVVEAGDEITVSGLISVYDNRMQLKLKNAAAIQSFNPLVPDHDSL